MSDVTDLSPIIKATKMQKKAALNGIGICDKNEAAEKILDDAVNLNAFMSCGYDIEKNTGEIIFDVINIARILGISAEAALHETCRKFLEEASKNEEGKA